jgi:hypothetical protein
MKAAIQRQHQCRVLTPRAHSRTGETVCVSCNTLTIVSWQGNNALVYRDRRTGVFGPAGQKGRRREVDAHCAGHPRGPVCDPYAGICACKSDADCGAASQHCVAAFAGPTKAHSCQAPCKANGDCPPASPFCQQKTKRCVACRVDQDCRDAGEAICSTTTGQCEPCFGNGECIGHPDGESCIEGRCGCTSDLACDGKGQGANSWGGVCLADRERCGCREDSACAASANGTTCFRRFGKCSCASDQDCAASGSPGKQKCALPYAGAPYRHCRPSCASDGDCAGTLPHCQSGRCVQCAADADCAGSAQGPYCTPSASCGACITAADCGPDSLGGVCRHQICVCDGDADCVNNSNGKKCIGPPDATLCGCTSNLDCPSGKTCTGVVLGDKICL